MRAASGATPSRLHALRDQIAETGWERWTACVRDANGPEASHVDALGRSLVPLLKVNAHVESHTLREVVRALVRENFFSGFWVLAPTGVLAEDVVQSSDIGDEELTAEAISIFLAREIPIGKGMRLALARRLRAMDRSVRWTSARVLSGAANYLPVREALVDSLADGEWIVGEAAAQALAGTATDPTVQQALLDCLRSETVARVRKAAVRALSEVVEHPRVYPAIVELARTDEDYEVRSAARAALSPLVHLPVVCQAFLERLDDGVGHYQDAKQIASTVVGAPHLQEAISEQLRWNEDSGVRAGAATLLRGGTDNPIVREALLYRACHDADGFVRRYATQALFLSYGHRDVQNGLLAQLSDPFDHVRWAATKTLGLSADQPLVRDALEKLLSTDASGWVRRTAVQALAGSVGDDSVLRRFVKLVHADADAYVRREAVKALGVVVDHTLVRGALVERLRDEHEGVREEASKALSSVAHENAVRDGLRELLESDENYRVRIAAAEALADVADSPIVLDLLIERLFGDSDLHVRWAVATVLTKAASLSCVRGALLDRLEKASTEPTEATTHALGGAVAYSPFFGILIDRLSDEQRAVRLNAAENLKTADYGLLALNWDALVDAHSETATLRRSILRQMRAFESRSGIRFTPVRTLDSFPIAQEWQNTMVEEYMHLKEHLPPEVWEQVQRQWNKASR